MAKAGIFMGIICIGVIGWVGVFDGGIVIGPCPSLPTRGISPQRGERCRVLNIAHAEVGVRELTGNNDGVRVEQYLAYTGLKKGNPWCAAYVSFVFHKAGYDQPKTAWSPALFPVLRLTTAPKPADVFGIWFPELKRIAHVGLVARVKGDWLTTYEGNSNNSGSRNGDGVYQRLRHKRTVSKFADWIISNN